MHANFIMLRTDQQLSSHTLFTLLSGACSLICKTISRNGSGVPNPETCLYVKQAIENLGGSLKLQQWHDLMKLGWVCVRDSNTIKTEIKTTEFHLKMRMLISHKGHLSNQEWIRCSTKSRTRVIFYLMAYHQNKITSQMQTTCSFPRNTADNDILKKLPCHCLCSLIMKISK